MKEQTKIPLFSPEDTGCILCGRCLAVCPALAATGREELSPRSKGYLIQTLEKQPGRLSLKKVKKLAALCAGCNRCASVCPQGLDIPAALARLKASTPGWKDWIWKTALAHPEYVLPPVSTRQHLGKRDRDLLQPWLQPDLNKSPHAGKTVALFSGCMAEYGVPAWKEKALALLTSLGMKVLPPIAFQCCAFPFAMAGLEEKARSLRLANVQAWRDAGRPLIATLCRSCREGLTRYKDEDLGWKKDEVLVWEQSLPSLNAFLHGVQGDISGLAPAGGVLYHRPCHGGDEPVWLQTVLKDKVAFEQTSDCCGFGGSLQLINRDLSRSMADVYWENIPVSLPCQVLSDCSGCILQLKQTRPEGVSVGHWLEILKI